MTERQGNLIEQYDQFAVPATNAELRDRVTRSVVDLFLRRRTRSNAISDLMVHLHNHLQYAALCALLLGAADAHERLEGPAHDHGAFRLVFAID